MWCLRTTSLSTSKFSQVSKAEDCTEWTEFLLYGNQGLSFDLNNSILKLALRFIHETGRFDLDLLSSS